MPLYLQILRCVRSGIKYKSEPCIALRLCALAQEFDFEEDIITKEVKATKIGSYNVNKDFLLPTNEDRFVKRGVNSISSRSVVIWTSFIPPELLANIEKGI